MRSALPPHEYAPHSAARAIRARKFVALIALGSLSCASAPKARPAAKPCTLPAKIQLQASERINPDVHGEALPTVVRVYELRAIGRVEESDFAAIWETPKEALAEDLVAVRELTLFPGQAEALELALKPEVKFLVGVAIFRRPTGTQWRAIIPLPESSRLCAAYAKKGAPEPAVSFRFDQYRAEGRSRLLGASGEHDLPLDVAPDRASHNKAQR